MQQPNRQFIGIGPKEEFLRCIRDLIKARKKMQEGKIDLIDEVRTYRYTIDNIVLYRGILEKWIS